MVSQLRHHKRPWIVATSVGIYYSDTVQGLGSQIEKSYTSLHPNTVAKQTRTVFGLPGYSYLAQLFDK